MVAIVPLAGGVAERGSVGGVTRMQKEHYERTNMNKTVLGVLGFLLLAPGLVILGIGGIIVGPLLCAAGAGLLILAIRPEWFKRYIVTVAVVFSVAALLLVFGIFFAKGHAEKPYIHEIQ
jgi:hypothetical protein